MGDERTGAEGHREAEWRWLGTRRFWLLVAVVLVLAVGFVWRANRNLSRPEALVPVVTLSGPREATKGETVHYAVLVRDAFGAPLPRAVVRVGFWKPGFIELGRSMTGLGGDSTVDVQFPEDFAEPRSLVAIAEAGVADGTDVLVVTPRTPGQGSIFISTDKPIYQPGQIIHLRALAMADDKPLGDRATVIEIRADGVKLFRAEKPTSSFGVVAADFPLADQVKLGQYTIDVTTTVTPPIAGDASGNGSRGALTVQAQRQVEVKRYSLPKMKVALEEVSPFAPEEPLRGTARATWIFGQPVTKATMTVWLDRPGSSPRRSVVGETDRTGAFHFELPPGPGKPEQQPRGTFTLHARVSTGAGTGAETTQQVTTLKGELKLEAFPESGVLVPGVEQTVFVVVTQSRSKAGVTVREQPYGPAAKTSEQGIAAVKVHPDVKAKTIDLFAFAEDGSDAKLEVPTVSDTLVVRPDRDSYSGGDTVHVRVLGAGARDHVSLRMTKGSEPIAMGSCVVVAPEAGCEAALAIPAGASGLAWVHALSLPEGKRDIQSGKRLILTGWGSRDLDLHLTPDKPAWAPRDVGSVDVAVTGAGGAPVAAQLGVAVIDEAVFALSDVRPDLEKIFFTVNQDIARTRRPSYGYYGSGSQAQHSPPPSFEAAAAYQASTASDVRSTILAALTTMADVGGVDASTSSAVASQARLAVSNQKTKLLAWCILALTALTLAAFAAFALYAGSRFRRPLLLATPEASADQITALRLETRGLFVDWLGAVLAPPVLAVAGMTAAEILTGSYSSSRGVVGTWLVLAAFCALLLVRAVLRVRRVQVAQEASTLRRALFFLPLALFCGHLTLLLVLVDAQGGEGLRGLLGYRSDAFFLPLAIVFATQLTCGLLSVVRQTQLRPVSRRGRVWLLASRATYLGLPVTLLCGGMLVFEHVKDASDAGWTDYSVQRGDVAAETADNKEGGTGTRAKGEEGSMGNPSTKGSGARSGVQGGDGDGARTPVVVRDYFPETLLWAPDVLTDDQGHARIQLPFADSITTWRFGLSAVSRAGQLGSATLPLVVTQDFFVDATLPPVLTQGDEIAVPVTVFSYTSGAQDVLLELEGEGMSPVGPARLGLHLEKGEARAARFVVKADRAGDRMVRIKATSPTHADAMERKVTVTPNGQAITRTMSGRVVGSAQATVELPQGAIDGGNDLYVKLYGGPLSQVSEGLDGVFRMPHGCFEQTSSTTYPSVMALQFLARTKSVSPEVERKARDYIGQGYQRLVSFEVPGGGFSLFGKEPAATILTAYGLLELSDMARVATVDASLVERTREWLYTKRTPTGGWTRAPHDPKDTDAKDDPTITAYIAWALAASATRPDARLKGVLDIVAQASSPEAGEPYALTIRASALQAGERLDDARPLLERLVRTAVHSDDGVHFTSAVVGAMYSSGPSMDVELTGLATHALALAGMAPDLRPGALDWLVARRGPYGTWSTTQATVAAMRALLDEAQPVTTGPQDIHVLVDGEEQESFTMAAGARDVHHLVSLRRAATTGKHVVEMRVTGQGDVSYQLVARHYLPWQRGPGAALGLDVAYAPTAVDAGSTMACRVRVAWRGKVAARMPLVEIGVPPAFEVETDELDALLRNGPGSTPVQRYTVERGKVTLYLLAVAEDKPVTIDLHMRALWHATVVAPSSSAYLYYEPEVRAETAPVKVQAL